jgi:hypothetical protein
MESQTPLLTHKVVSKSGLRYSKYKIGHNEKMKGYYHGNETCRTNKCSKIFFKNLKLMKYPHDKSLIKYQPSIQDIEIIRNELLKDGDPISINKHFDLIIERITNLG